MTSQTSIPVPSTRALRPEGPSAKTTPGQRRIFAASARSSDAREEKVAVRPRRSCSMSRDVVSSMRTLFTTVFMGSPWLLHMYVLYYNPVRARIQSGAGCPGNRRTATILKDPGGGR